MRDLTKGKKPIPIKPTKQWGIYGADELVFEYDTRAQAERQSLLSRIK